MSFRKYFRVDLQGLEYVPRRGRVLIAPNHSGCSGLDAVMLGYLLHENIPRVPRILALWSIFKRLPRLAPIAEKMGLKPAALSTGIQLLRKNNMVVCFPEGEAGSFKPTHQRYRLQEFKTGFIRMALLTGAPIVPCLIIGAEESNINLGTIHLKRGHRTTLLPVPFNVLPLPAKWKIRFLPPIDLSEHRHHANDRAALERLAETVRAKMQAAIDHELHQREYVYLKHA